MKPKNLVELRYKYAGIAASENSGALYRAAAKDILDLLDRVEFYQDEMDRLVSKAQHVGDKDE